MRRLFCLLLLAGCAPSIPNVQPAVSSYATHADRMEDTDIPTFQLRTQPADGWVHPPGEARSGWVISDLELRRNLNQAVEMAPVGGTRRWQSGDSVFQFMALNAVYPVTATGEWCRDGLLTRLPNTEPYGYQPTPPEQVRGLFCKAGPGGDWMLMR